MTGRITVIARAGFGQKRATPFCATGRDMKKFFTHDSITT
jgi:hypothetical protein